MQLVLKKIKNLDNTNTIAAFFQQNLAFRLKSLLFFYMFLVFIMSCESFQAEYADPEDVDILDDKWNETDARATAERVIKNMLEKSWLSDYIVKKKKRPVVVVGNIDNRTDEHIDTKSLTEYISDELINSGKVRFVAGEKRQTLLKELSFQTDSGNVSNKTAKKRKRYIGADYMLTGGISSIVQSQGGKKVVTYQTQVRLLDIETSEIVWSHKDNIKKRFKRSSLGL